MLLIKTYIIMKILMNATVTKLKEYSRSYGVAEEIFYPFLRENEKSIECLNDLGNHCRSFKKNTKLLISFTGKEITERAFRMRCKKAITTFEVQLALKEKKEIKEHKIFTELKMLTEWCFEAWKPGIMSKVRKEYPLGLSHKTSKAAAFRINKKCFGLFLETLHLATLIRKNYLENSSNK